MADRTLRAVPALETGPLVDLEAVRAATVGAEHAPVERLADALVEVQAARAHLEAVLSNLVTRAALVSQRAERLEQPDHLLTVAEVAAQIGQCHDFVRDHRDDLGGRKQGGSLRFSQRAVEDYKRRRAAGQRC